MNNNQPLLISMTDHVAYLIDPSKTGKYYYLFNDGVNVVPLPWIALDKTGPQPRSAQFATKEEAFVFLGAVEAITEVVTPSSEVLERAESTFEPQADLTPVPAPVEPSESLQQAETPNTSLADTSLGEPLDGFVRCSRCAMDDNVATTPDFDYARQLCPACVAHVDNPYSNLTDDQLEDAINAAERAWFEPYRVFAETDAQFTALMAKLETEHAALLERRKTAKEQKALRADDLKKIAAEYFRRNPDERKYDVYVTAKEFKHVEIDEPLAIEWAEENYPAAITRERVTLDHGRVKDYVLDLVKRKYPIPNFAKFKLGMEVQLSSKVPPPDAE